MTSEEVAAWARSGIYAITNTVTGEQYVGKATFIGGRWSDHLRLLRHRKHANRLLQAAWTQHGESAFSFAVLEYGPTDDVALRPLEQAWIDKLKPAYNRQMAVYRPPAPRPAVPRVLLQPRQHSITRPSSRQRGPRARSKIGLPLPYLRAWRARKLLTQDELAEKTGLSRATVTRADRGDEVVSFANIRKIAEALGVSPEDLLKAPPEGAE